MVDLEQSTVHSGTYSASVYQVYRYSTDVLCKPVHTYLFSAF